MQRSYFATDLVALSEVTTDAIVGAMAAKLPFALEPTQRGAWVFEIEHMRSLALELAGAHLFFELMIPRMGRRADVVLLYGGIIFVVEYKVGSASFDRHALEQAYGYGLDLKHFHETSHLRRVVPIVVATAALPALRALPSWDVDGLAKSLVASPSELGPLIRQIALDYAESPLNPDEWVAGRYKPTPTIVEAAQALYRGHDVQEISRSEAGAENLSATASYIAEVIEQSKANSEKSICFVTGVPGSGKTLAGLNIANLRMRAHDDEHAVFLSGNGPLVDVLRAALANDAVEQARARGEKASRVEEERKAGAFIQNIHHFRDEALLSTDPPVGKVVIFDEAQRAWGAAQTSKFMREKRGQAGFAMSEPQFLLSVMDRHSDWCTIVCLVGDGQEINTGEAGIEEWLRSLRDAFPHWKVHLSDKISPPRAQMVVNFEAAPSLHLATSVRSFRAEKLAGFVGALIDNGANEAAAIVSELSDYPMAITRDLRAARRWLRERRRGNERAGLLASSNALRLKPHGIYVKAKIEPPLWFLAPSQDVRSSDALEDAATEFDVQGLELDWACVCWDANFRRGSNGWQAMQFKGTKWQVVADPDRQRYIANSYRVLLTRARQGMVIFVPDGDRYDATRTPELYDPIFQFFSGLEIPLLSGS